MTSKTDERPRVGPWVVHEDGRARFGDRGERVAFVHADGEHQWFGSVNRPFQTPAEGVASTMERVCSWLDAVLATWADFEDAAAPHVAVLPDGTKVALPAGTVLRKATADEIEAEKLLDVRTMLHFLKPTAEEAAQESALTQARALLRRARAVLWKMAPRREADVVNGPTWKECDALAPAIDDFLAGLPVTAARDKAWTEEQIRAALETAAGRHHIDADEPLTLTCRRVWQALKDLDTPPQRPDAAIIVCTCRGVGRPANPSCPLHGTGYEAASYRARSCT